MDDSPWGHMGSRLSNFHFTILKRIICGKATKKIGMTIVFEGHIFNTSYELCSMDNLVFEIYQKESSLPY